MIVSQIFRRNTVLFVLPFAFIAYVPSFVLATIKTETDTLKSNATQSQMFFEKISKYCYERYDASCFWLDCLRFVEKYYNFTSLQLFKGVYLDRVNASFFSSGSDSTDLADFLQRQMAESPSQLLDSYIQHKVNQIFGNLVVKIHLLPEDKSSTNNSTTANRSSSTLDAGRKRFHFSSTLYAVVLGTAAAMLTKSLTLSVIALILSVLRVPRFPLVPGFNGENSSYRLAASPPYPVLFNHNHHHANNDVQYVDDVGGGAAYGDGIRDTYHINYWPRKKHNHDVAERLQATAKV